jgi:hypothetical protein
VSTLAGADLQSLVAGQPPDDTLLVPIDVQALVTGSAGKERVPTETVVPNVPENTAESATLPQPPPLFAPASPRAPGIHLHWAMPDALTRGDAGTARSDPVPAGNPTGLRPLPDRWVVVRMVHGQQRTRSWVLMADRGERADLVGWVEPGVLPAGTVTGKTGRRVFPPERLNAVAGADVAWAATYDAVADRFGFYDDLAGVHLTAMISYLVIGWWTNVANNPLAGVGGIGYHHIFRYWNRMSDYGWGVPIPYTPPPPEPPPPKVPPFVLLHGALCGVKANGEQAPDLKPDPAAIDVAVGGSGFGAFAALLGEGTAEQRDASERVLAAFNSGLLARVDAPDGIVAIDEDRHASAFVGISDGTRPVPDRVAEGDPFHAPDAGTPSSSDAPPESAAPAHAVLRDRGEHDVATAAAAVSEPSPGPLPEPRVFRDVPTSRPRFFVPADIALLLRGGRRNLRHGGDGRFNATGELICRLSHELVLQVGGVLRESDLPAGLRSLGSSRVPKECDWLLRETVLTDPYRTAERTSWTPSSLAAQSDAVEARLHAETALRHPPEGSPFQQRPDRDGSGNLVRAALGALAGDPVGIQRWCQPWVPLWCEWDLSARVDEDLARWILGPTDLAARRLPDGASEVTVRGRTLLHASAGRAFAAQVRAWLEEERLRDLAGEGIATPETEATLAAAATAAETLDVLLGTFAGLRETLLGLDPSRAGTVRIDVTGAQVSKPTAQALPRLLAGGAAVLRRLRIVDAFGRIVNVEPVRLARMEVASTHRHPAAGARLVLAPRFQCPARLALRLIDPRPPDAAPAIEARIDQENPAAAVSPVAGWLLPDHVDEALECFDAEGRPLGQLIHDPLTGAVVWEAAPGRPGPIAGPPDPGDDAGARHVTRFAAGVVQADATARNDPAAPPQQDSALSALLRGIDTTLWSVDPVGSVGTAAVAGLVGRPIAVIRAVLRLDVLSDIDQLAYLDPTATNRAARARAYAELARHSVTVRLGELTRTDDGLLAYAVDDVYDHLRLVAPEVRSFARQSRPREGQLGLFGAGSQRLPALSPIAHPYVAGPTDLAIHPGQEIRLTLLMTPGGKVHVTSGLLPRKGLALARDWFQAALERLSPSFRVGPVLVEPTGVRMPRVTGLGDRQTFTRRTNPLTWRDDPILAASQTALLPDDPSGLQEGWIRVVPESPEESA